MFTQVAANLVKPDPHHAATMVRFALRARQEAAKVPRPDTNDGSTLSLRIGKHPDRLRGVLPPPPCYTTHIAFPSVYYACLHSGPTMSPHQ